MNNEVEKYISEWFINLNAKKLPFSYYLVRKSLLAAVTELKPKLHGSIVDLGCGTMPYKKFLFSEKIETYIGVDLKEADYQPDIYWDGKTIPLSDSSADFVIATEFFEHYFETELVLSEIKRILKPGGTLFFTVPWVWPLHEVPYDYHRFTPFALGKKVELVGFSNSVIKPLGGVNYHFALSLSLWFENSLSLKKQAILKPFARQIITWLMKRDYMPATFQERQLFSGLYGYVTK